MKYRTALTKPFFFFAIMFAILPVASAVNVPFTAHDAGSGLGFPWRIESADLDGDGDLDIIVPGSNEGRLSWLENDGGRPATFTVRPITTTSATPSSVFGADMDGDGDIDILSSSWTDDKVTWYENDGAADPTFTEMVIATTADFGESVVAVDVDSDGDLDIASASSSDNEIAWYENDGAANPTFTLRTITNAANGAAAVFYADLDRDGDMDLMSANLTGDQLSWYESDGAADPTFTKRDLTTTLLDFYYVNAADVDGDGDVDILAACIQPSNAIAWYENDGATDPTFTERVIPTASAARQTIEAADIDCDGDMDIIATQGSGVTEGAYWYESNGATPPVFTERTLEVLGGGASPLYNIARDVDGDGDTDVIVADYGTDEIKYYENRLIHKDIDLPNETVVDDSVTSGPAHVEMGDLNGDEIVDFVVSEIFGGTVEWYINDGAGTYTRRSMAGPSAATDLKVVDLDSDGNRDVIAADAGFAKVVWFGNNGGADPTFTERTIDGASTNVRQVAYGDLDRDGDIDVVAGAQTAGEVRWYESDGASPPTFTINVLSSALTAPAGVCVADFNGDGHLDVAACDLEGAGTEVRLFTNDGAADPTFSSNLLQGSTDGHFKLHAADMDGDGDMDVVTQSLNTPGGWYESSGGTSPTFTFNPITGLTASRQTVPIDFDKDGDIDILEAAASDGTVNWYENDGQQPASFTQQIEVVPSTDAQYGIGAGDLDRDGDLDIISTYRNGNEIVALENTGTQYTAVLSPTTLMGLGEDTSPKAIFSLDITHNGIAGDRELYFNSYKILFEENAADPLTSGELAGMLDGFHVRKENGAGIFDILSNDFIQTFGTSPTLTAGVLDGVTNIEPNRDIAPGETDTFYFAVDPANMAASATPNQFVATFQGADLDAVYSVTPEVSVGSVSLSGNAIADASTPTITFGVAPVAGSVVLTTMGPVNTGPAEFLVTFGEDVVGFDSENDLVLTETGTASHSGVSFTGGPQVFTVAVNNLSGDGTLSLAVSTESDIADLDGIPLESSQISSAITIDNTAPVITLTDGDLTLECGIDTFTDPGFSANDNIDGDITANVVVAGETVDVSMTGTYVITYNVMDASNNPATEVSRTVTVQDTTAPDITITGENPVDITQLETYTDEGATANDDCDGDLTSSITTTDDVDTSTIGSYTVTYNVMDGSGNSAMAERTVNVIARPSDLNEDGSINSSDIQLIINIVLGVGGGGLDGDVNGDGSVNSIDIQLVINTVLGVV